ncbi:MAG TPA: hypothetical protein VGV38_12750, partial [Pyrinomonadaceae bacterium]|nr:hypothetical protein [Pyrinomonadaceae bacterium]
MFCPQCGQQQVSDEVRFCSRCGFQLSAVTGLLTTGGVAASPSAELQTGESPRRRGMRHGMTMFFVGIVLTIVLAILFGDGEVEVFPAILIPLSAAVFILGGVLRAIYAFIFEEGKRK